MPNADAVRANTYILGCPYGITSRQMVRIGLGQRRADLVPICTSLQGRFALNRVILNLCGATTLKLKNSGGIVVSWKKHWLPGSDVAVQSVERSEVGGRILSGVLAPNRICPDCGLHSRRRHGWRRRRLQDYPAHGDKVTVDLAVCHWRCLAPACPRRTFADQIASIARPFARRTSHAGEIASHLGMRPADGQSSGCCIVWAFGSAMTQCSGS